MAFVNIWTFVHTITRDLDENPYDVCDIEAERITKEITDHFREWSPYLTIAQDDCLAPDELHMSIGYLPNGWDDAPPFTQESVNRLGRYLQLWYTNVRRLTDRDV